MKNTLSKMLVASAISVACCMTSTMASASVYPEFKIDQQSNGIVLSSNQNQFVTANKLVGNYNEVITFNGNTFQASILYQPAQFSLVGGLNSVSSGAGSDYALYALYVASGVVTTSGGTSTFTFTPSSTDSFNFYLDPVSQNSASATKFTSPLTGATAFGRTASGDDILLATGSPIKGAGSINCYAENVCGSFSTTTSFDLTEKGQLFFIDPKPFYSLTIETGQLNGFTPSGQVTINGSIDTIFAVPEPTSTALLGLGLLSFAVSRRKWAKSKAA